MVGGGGCWGCRGVKAEVAEWPAPGDWQRAIGWCPGVCGVCSRWSAAERGSGGGLLEEVEAALQMRKDVL